MQDSHTVRDFPTIDLNNIKCESCVNGKFRKETTHTKQIQGGIIVEKETAPGIKLHTDISGEITPAFPYNGKHFKYFQVIVDDFSRNVSVKLLESKNEALVNLIDTIAHMERHLNVVVTTLHMDGGTEIICKEFKTYCTIKGISIEQTPAHSPHMNGVAERYIRAIKEIARPIHLYSSLPDELWGHAVLHAGALKNLWPNQTNDNMSAHERLYGHKPMIGHLITYGCKVSVPNYLQRERGGTFKPQCKDKIYVGFHTPTLIKALDPVSCKVTYHRRVDCQFYEDILPPVTGKPHSKFYWDHETLPKGVARTKPSTGFPSPNVLVKTALERRQRLDIDAVAELLGSRARDITNSPSSENVDTEVVHNDKDEEQSLNGAVCKFIVSCLIVLSN
jgi:hypothetical protein